MTRKNKILDKINPKKGVGLEIGPLTTPVLLKEEAIIKYVDHMSTSELKKKYADEPVDTDEIVDVDFVVGNSSLKDTLGDKKFDYIIASHVIEHIPDMIRWLQDTAAILKPSGVLSLVIPDKRYTFDITRQVSKPSDIFGAYIDELSRPNSSTMYDFAYEFRSSIIASEVIEDKYADFSKKQRRFSDMEVWEMTEKSAKGDEYVDSHCLVFTPYSFFEILKALIKSGLFDFEVASFFDTQPGELEFYVSLRKINNKVTPSVQLKSIPQLPKPLEIRELEQQLAAARNELGKMRASKSWALTKPMRATAGSVRKIKKLRRPNH